MTSINENALKNEIREWIKTDNDIYKMKTQLKQLNEKKKALSSSIINTMKSSSIGDININDGIIKRKESKIKKSITKKYLLAQLTLICPETAEDIVATILNNRDCIVKEIVEHKINV